MDQEYINYYLNRSGAVHEIECIEFSHPDFSKTYYVQSYDEDGLNLKHENGSIHNYEYAPIRIDRANTSDDLDQKINITLGDMGLILPLELKRAKSGANYKVKPKLIYRLYRSDNLLAPLYVLQILEMATLSRDASGAATFTAEAVQLNNTKVGETYTFDRFPLLRGVI